MGKPIDITGEQYGSLTAVKIDHLGKRNKRYWLCKCECGKYTVQSVSDLRTGKVKSCGCNRYMPLVERNITHGESKTRLYHIWRGMKTRCQNPNHGDYANYGARGITVCSEWNDSYEVFRDWAMSHGYSDNLTIERNDVNGDYCPENCRWATKKEQANNRRNTVFIEYKGERHTISECAEIKGINRSTLNNRYVRGYKGDKLFAKEDLRLCHG